MIVQEPLPHWNNFTVLELKEILEHCRALKKLGIAQDEELIDSIERDIALREKKKNAHQVTLDAKKTRIKHQKEKQNHIKINKRQQLQEYLLQQNV